MAEEKQPPQDSQQTSHASVGNVNGGIHDSIFAGRDAIGNIIAGEHAQVFVGGYERLRDAYIQPQQVFERVALQHFAGREWLLAEIDTFLSNQTGATSCWRPMQG